MTDYTITVHNSHGRTIARFGCSGRREDAFDLAEGHLASGGSATVFLGGDLVGLVTSKPMH